VLKLYVEEDVGASELIARGFEPELVNRAVRLVDTSEYSGARRPRHPHHRPGLWPRPAAADNQPVPGLKGAPERSPVLSFFIMYDKGAGRRDCIRTVIPVSHA